jgi:hypothetical protein
MTPRLCPCGQPIPDTFGQRRRLLCQDCYRAQQRAKWHRYYAKHRASERLRLLAVREAEFNEDAALIERKFALAKRHVTRTLTPEDAWSRGGHVHAGWPTAGDGAET